MRLSAAVITKDEERNIGECLRSLSFCDEVVVVDSGSTDRTAEIARSLGAAVHVRKFKDFSDQKNFAASQALGEWVLSVDADERVSEGLKKEILSALEDRKCGAYRDRKSTRLNSSHAELSRMPSSA